jgi:TorA maturation chaperone TorD
MSERAARGRVYSILAKLLVAGLDAATLERLRALDGWLLDGGAVLDLDELAAQHHACFHLDLFPYAGVFLDRSAVAGGCSDMVSSYFAQAGFRPRLDQLAADHLGVMLGFLGFVCAATDEALQDGRPALAAQLERLTAEFLDDCILAWLPSLVAAIDETQPKFWPNVLRETLEFSAVHRIALRDHVPAVRAPELPDTDENLLDDPGTGLRRIAEHLLTPATSGVLLSRADVARLGRERSLPRGFGSRLIMLDNLLRSAVDHARLGELLADLDSLLAARDRALTDIGARLELDVAVAPWRRALARTRALVSTVATELI